MDSAQIRCPPGELGEMGDSFPGGSCPGRLGCWRHLLPPVGNAQHPGVHGFKNLFLSL